MYVIRRRIGDWGRCNPSAETESSVILDVVENNNNGPGVTLVGVDLINDAGSADSTAARANSEIHWKDRAGFAMVAPPTILEFL